MLLQTQVSLLITDPHPTFLFISEILEKELVANQRGENLSMTTGRIIGHVLENTAVEKQHCLKFRTIFLPAWPVLKAAFDAVEQV